MPVMKGLVDYQGTGELVDNGRINVAWEVKPEKLAELRALIAADVAEWQAAHALKDATPPEGRFPHALQDDGHMAAGGMLMAADGSKEELDVPEQWMLTPGAKTPQHPDGTPGTWVDEVLLHKDPCCAFVKSTLQLLLILQYMYNRTA